MRMVPEVNAATNGFDLDLTSEHIEPMLQDQNVIV